MALMRTLKVVRVPSPQPLKTQCCVLSTMLTRCLAHAANIHQGLVCLIQLMDKHSKQQRL